MTAVILRGAMAIRAPEPAPGGQDGQQALASQLLDVSHRCDPFDGVKCDSLSAVVWLKCVQHDRVEGFIDLDESRDKGALYGDGTRAGFVGIASGDQSVTRSLKRGPDLRCHALSGDVDEQGSPLPLAPAQENEFIIDPNGRIAAPRCEVDVLRKRQSYALVGRFEFRSLSLRCKTDKSFGDLGIACPLNHHIHEEQHPEHACEPIGANPPYPGDQSCAADHER
jgi:hypothetical protein